MEKETCKVCGGKGYIEKQYKTIYDLASGRGMEQCPFCNGYGFTIIQGEEQKSA